MTIAVFGSINNDVTAYSDRLPRPGETLHGSRYLTGLGGKGANQAAAAARLGASTKLIGRVGRDDFGKSALEHLKSFGVDVHHVTIDAVNPTGIAIINVDRRGENFITVIAGANFAIDATDAEKASAALARAAVLLLQLEVPWAPMMLAAGRARAEGAKVILDPAPASPEVRRLDLGLVDIITPNETETEILTGVRPTDEASAAAAARILHSRGPGTALIKLGERGAYLSMGGNGLFIPAFKVDAVDTVAAGDCFNAGLAFALSRGRALIEAARFASACGALSTTKYGAAAAAPTLAEVERLLGTQ
jgi:ribokinase